MTAQKIFKNREDLRAQILAWQATGSSVGFTSGVFDLLHQGHIEYLEEAKKRCDYLIVAVNSDSSVRINKGELRPIVSEDERLRLIAALESVSAVFLFSELNNQQNILELKPNVYFKAGDYSKEKLTSAKLVESYGGRVEILSFIAGNSTSGIIQKILSTHQGALPQELPIKKGVKKPAIFLDRDGTIIKHVEYLSEPDRVEVLPGVLGALKRFQDRGFYLIVVTNQPGIGLGYLSKEDFFKVNLQLFKLASSAGVLFDKVYFCPHSKSEKCSCRKPSLALIERACADLPIDLAKSYVIGDSTVDIQLAKNAGCRSVLVKTGNAGKDGVYDVAADFVFEDLAKVELESC